MIARELIILVVAFFGFAFLISAYQLVFHGGNSMKETLSGAFSAVVGLYAGRFLERRLINGRP